MILIAIFLLASVMFASLKWGAPRTARNIKDAAKIAKKFGRVLEEDAHSFLLENEVGKRIIARDPETDIWKVIYGNFQKNPLEIEGVFQKMASLNSRFPLAKMTLEREGQIIQVCSDVLVFNKKALGFVMEVMKHQLAAWNMLTADAEEMLAQLPPELREALESAMGTTEEPTMGFRNGS